MMEGHICRSTKMQKLLKIYYINISNISRLIFLISNFQILMASTSWSKTVAFNLDVHHPIVFQDPSKDSYRETYFGYSVLLYSELKHNNSWIQIGAPRANSTFSWNEPGAVYRCQLSSHFKCGLLNVTGNGANKNEFNEKKDGAWLGAAMDVQPGPNGRVVVCSPRWIRELEKKYYMVGSCYWSTERSESFKMLVPLRNKKRYRDYSTNSYEFGLGEAGISVHLTNEVTPKLVIGTPGLLNWKGGLVLYEDDISAFSNLSLPAKNTTLTFPDDDYIGYQVNSGHFFKKDVLLYVASAPRANNLRGKVMLLHIKVPGKKMKYKIRKTVFGIQCGEYFGASIAVGDLNNDTYDDLIVGAPFFSNEDVMVSDYERGRIAVFFSTPWAITKAISEKNGQESGKLEPMLEKSEQIIGYKAGSRFGSTVVFLGDINSDNFPEVAVGAPYEDEGRGAVYIYSSDKNGHLGQYVQRLTAQDCYEHLRGFGSSISLHNVDIDGNGCPDLAIGAYLSGHAVIYRGQPVIKLEVENPKPLPTSILYNATDFTLQHACVTYHGKNASNEIQIQRTLELDFIYFRCTNSELRKNITLHKGIKDCEDLKIHLKSTIRNVIEPLKVKITYELIKEEKNKNIILVKGDGVDGVDSFCKECPITQDQPTAVLSIPFAVNCGGNSVCTADLSVRGELPELKNGLEEETLLFVTGSSSILTFQMLVSNNKTADTAYSTYLYIEIGAPATLSRLFPECHMVSSRKILKDCTEGKINNTTESSDSQNLANTYLECEIGNISPGKERNVSLELDMTNTQGRNKMELAVWVTTTNNEESNPSDNCWSGFVKLNNEADITIVGKGVPEISPMILGSKNERETNIHFTHYYEVQKFGYSIIDKVSIELLVPMFITDINSNKSSKFLTIGEYKGYQGSQPLSCDFDDPFDSDDEMQIEDHSIRKRFAIEDISTINRAEIPSDRTMYINCSSPDIADTHLIECRTVKCTSGPFINNQTVAEVTLSMEIDIQKLELLMGPRHIILLKTYGSVEVIKPHDLLQPSNGPNDAETHSIFIADVPNKKLETWVLALAIAAGIMIMLFLVMALAKAGFFKRKKKDELKALKRQTMLEISDEFLQDFLHEESLEKEGLTELRAGCFI